LHGEPRHAGGVHSGSSEDTQGSRPSALIEDKLQAFRITEADGFKVFNEVIETPGDG
jgi:hypothetical protein